jgi:hypothetical protein
MIVFKDIQSEMFQQRTPLAFEAETTFSITLSTTTTTDVAYTGLHQYPECDALFKA